MFNFILDFLELEMKPMEDGECDPNNSLYISTTVPDAYVPVKQLCGTVHRVYIKKVFESGAFL